MEVVYTRLKQLLGETNINKCKRSHISQVKTTLRYFNKLTNGKITPILFTVRSEYFLADFLFPGHSETLKQNEKNLEEIQT